MDTITLAGMRFEGCHGVTDEERALPQLLEVDLEVRLDLEAAARTDDLDATVDYGPLIDIVRSVIEDGRQRLLEAVAGAILEGVLGADARTLGATVRVRKLAVPVDADLDFAQVTLSRERRAG